MPLRQELFLPPPVLRLRSVYSSGKPLGGSCRQVDLFPECLDTCCSRYCFAANSAAPSKLSSREMQSTDRTGASAKSFESRSRLNHAWSSSSQDLVSCPGTLEEKRHCLREAVPPSHSGDGTKLHTSLTEQIQGCVWWKENSNDINDPVPS